jgi:hypothetical protein
MLDKEFKSLVLEMISDLKEDSTNQMNEVREWVQDLDKIIGNMNEK